MQPKSTLNLLKKNILSELKRVSWRPFLPIYILLIVSGTSVSYSQSNSCKATLQVEKNRFTQSVSSEGTSYTLQITNTSSSNSNYTLNSSNVNSSCVNNDETSTSENINLNISFSDISGNSISEISLKTGETISFLVKINVPLGTTVNKWNCTEITATSSTCSSYKVSTILHTLVSDPNQE